MEIIRLSKQIEIHPSLNKIVIKKLGHNQAISVENQLMKLLIILADNREQLVEKDRFITEIWNGNYPVGEQALTKNIFKLRELFKKMQINDRIQIETIPKKGYRLVVKKSQIRFLNRKKLVVLLPFLLVIILASLMMWQKPKKNIELLEYDENNIDTIIHLSKNGKVKRITTDTLNAKVINLDDLSE